MNCPLCGANEVSLFFESQLGWSVRSDWSPVPASSSVLVCDACGHLFKSAELTRRWSDYESYHVWDNSPMGDKVDFQGDFSITRSDALIGYLERLGVRPDSSRVLDFGCQRGAFLARLNGGGHAGFDVSEQYRATIESLGCSYHTPSSPPPAATFDVMTLIHVAEHLEDFAQAMAVGIQALRSEGRVLLQVPDAFTRATDLYVMDHCSHFSAARLDAAAAKAGLIPNQPTTSILSGELSGFYGKGRANGRVASAPSRDSYNRIKTWLTQGESALISLKASNAKCLVYGGGLVGSLIGAYLGDQVEAFVDDSKALQGGKLGGKPVVSLEGLSGQGQTLVVAVPPHATARASGRAVAAGFRAVAPYGRMD